MAIPLSVLQTMFVLIVESVLIIDGALVMHQKLKFGAIALGASWVSS